MNLFCRNHLLKILNSFDMQLGPLDGYLASYFRANKACGSKDRACIAETIYGLMRWRALFDFLLKKPKVSWEERVDLFFQKKPEDFLTDTTIPLHIRLSFPKLLFQEIVSSWGEEKASKICLALNGPAPTTLRANTLKIGRDALVERLKTDGLLVSPTTVSPHGIICHKKVNFFALPAFKEGLFEVQDEASQLVALFCPAKPQDLVLDFCSGSGGKTLALACKLAGTGQLFLHDVRERALIEARRRLKRASIQNCQLIHSDEKEKLEKLKKKMDLVLVDSPCSGTGTLRRNPDMKWKYTPEMLDRLAGMQRTIFEQALSFVKPSGRIVYATCSILGRENGDQIDHFLKTYPLEVEGTPFQTLPEKGAMDGFFAVCFRKK